MHFDDRLETVLRHRGTSEAALRTQFRQLLDILGAENGRADARAARDPALTAEAWRRMELLAEAIPEPERAAIIRERGWRLRNPELAFSLASGEPEVASAALARAELSSQDWAALIPRLPVRARGLLRLRRDLSEEVEALLERLGVHDRGLPGPDPTGIAEQRPPDAEPVMLSDPPGGMSSDVTDSPDPIANLDTDPAPEGRSEISELVARIARFRREREASRERGDDNDEPVNMPRLPLGDEIGEDPDRIGTFGFAADTSGRIDWAELHVAPMVIGTRLARSTRGQTRRPESAIERALMRRQPIENAGFALRGAPAIAGEWIVNARPRFTDDGNFAGYVGRFHRLASAEDAASLAVQREADRMRQLLHELRTPVTAVQGYAEVIQQQLFGTAPHTYRALAAAIASDAARILAGFEELERLARLESGALELGAGRSDMTALAKAMIARLAPVLASREAGISLVIDGKHAGSGDVAVDREQAEALLWRLIGTLAGLCADGERIGAALSRNENAARLACALPETLLAQDDIFAADVSPRSEAVHTGLFGAGFALRLARAEARGAGGDLVREDGSIVLTLPILAQNDESMRSSSDPA